MQPVVVTFPSSYCSVPQPCGSGPPRRRRMARRRGKYGMKCKDIGAFLYFFVECLGGSLCHRIVGKCGNL